MEVFGATPDDFAKVKVKNARHGLQQPEARYRKEVTLDEINAAPIVADPLRLLEICATSDGAAAVVLSSMEYAKSRGAGATGAGRGDLHGHAELPEHDHRDAGVRDRLRARRRGAPAHTFRDSIAAAAYEQAGLGPDDLDLAEVYDLSTALELDWYENIGLCKPGEAERLLNDGDTTIGGRCR